VAIASATLEHILLETKCFTLFVTHHPQITHLSRTHPNLLSTFYMSFHNSACAASDGEGGGASRPAESTKPPGTQCELGKEEPQPEAITFLYKLVRGVANRSFGLNVARMANLPESVILRAAVKAAELEQIKAEGREGQDVSPMDVDDGEGSVASTAHQGRWVEVFRQLLQRVPSPMQCEDVSRSDGVDIARAQLVDAQADVQSSLLQDGQL